MTIIRDGEAVRDNNEIVLLASAPRTATTDSEDQTNHNSNYGAILIVDISEITATPILTPKLRLKDPVSEGYVDIWTAAVNLTAVGMTTYLFGLGGSGAAGDYTEATNLLLPRIFRFRMIHADADSATYSAAIILLS